MSSMRLRTCRSAVALLLLAAVVSPAAAAEGSVPDPTDASLSPTARLRALIDRVRLEQKGLATLEASFVQRQESSMLVEPQVSKGMFSYAAPDRVRWEYQSPKPISVVIDGREMTTWYRDLNRAETIKIGRYSNQVFKYLGASGSLDSLLDYFRVTVSFPGADRPYTLVLVPRYERIAKRLASMTLELDPRSFLPVHLRYVTADGDVTDYTFGNLKVNAGIPQDRFELNLTDGVEVKKVDLDRGGR
jgi:outer membrane lipoprotein-sorting protein